MTDIVKHERDASEATIRERTDSMDPVSIKWRKDGQLIGIGTVEISASQVKYFRHQQYVNLRFSRKTVANLGVWPANIVDLEFINVTVTKVDEKGSFVEVLYEFGKAKDWRYIRYRDDDMASQRWIEENDVQVDMLSRVVSTAKIEFLFDDTPYRRQLAALKKLENGEYNDLIAHFMGCAVRRSCPDIPLPDLGLLGKEMMSLNESQMSAIAKGLLLPFSLFQGPPGTGKTTTIAGFVIYYLLVHPDARILVCGPSNQSTNQLAREIRSKLEILRRYIPEASAARYYSLSYTDPDKDLDDINMITLCAGKDATFAALLDMKRNGEKMSREDTDEFYAMLERLCTEIFNETSVVCCTTSMAGSKMLAEREFDCVIVDEAAQAIDCECLIPFLRASKNAIFVGDHQQLGPTIKSEYVREIEFTHSLTLFDRLVSLGEKPEMLTKQYRMHPIIAIIASVLFYAGRIRNGVKAAARTPARAEFPWRDVRSPIAFIDVRGEEKQEEGSTSYINYAEAEKTIAVVRELQKRGVAAERIGVITLYRDQKAYLRQRAAEDLGEWAENLKISSVDGFQG
jgi:superfamily I DNA and/or RNA helicase